MYIYKSIESGDVSLQKTEVNSNVSLNSGSDGLNVVHFRKFTKDTNENIISGSYNTSGSYWQSLLLNFYLSGSYGPGYNTPSESKYKNPIYSLAEYNPKNPQHLWKFHGSGSVISISQKLFGEEIKRESFKLVDNSHPSGTVTIRDDGFGNLYPVNNHISYSVSPPSSSDNYVGNIFYRNGVVTITETGSYTHTPSTASITVGTMITASLAGENHFFITSSDVSTSIKFISTGSYASETETSTLKYFESASTTAVTALSASKKINNIFGGTHITSSVSSNVINLTNDANLVTNRTTTNSNDNLPSVSGSGGFNTTTGFGGGKAIIKYLDVTTDSFTLDFESVQTIYTREYTLVINPSEFNSTNNITTRALRSGSYGRDGEFLTQSPLFKNKITGSGWNPYFNTVGFYDDGNNCIMLARYSQNIQIPKKFPITCKVKLDI